ncbi:MAG: hypothetical protein M0R28_20395 [Pigmentiphaga sp.]|nr:hypothetical protein [Pigmentiphaga sp.]
MSETIILPGQREWFPADEWSADSHLFEDTESVWLSLMIARRPGTGALSRLMDAIWRTGRREAEYRKNGRCAD